MDLKGYYFDVEIKGVALVYAEDKERAFEDLQHAGVMCAGNKLRMSKVSIMSPPREEL